MFEEFMIMMTIALSQFKQVFNTTFYITRVMKGSAKKWHMKFQIICLGEVVKTIRELKKSLQTYQ